MSYVPFDLQIILGFVCAQIAFFSFFDDAIGASDVWTILEI